MENITEALKMAFAIMMFILALALSISCFSQARETTDFIITMRDREVEYSYIETTEQVRTRLVSSETIVPTIYKALKENIRIEFYDRAENELYLFRYTDSNGNSKTANYIDLEEQVDTKFIQYPVINYGGATGAVEVWDKLLSSSQEYVRSDTSKFKVSSNINKPLYKYFSEHQFEEQLGEYYQEDATIGAVSETLEINKTKKRVITYILQP